MCRSSVDTSTFNCKCAATPIPAAGSAGLAVGNIVVPVDPARQLRSGCSCYDYAIVISLQPFVLASAGGDMRWSTTVSPAGWRCIGQADPVSLQAALRRLAG